MSFRDTGFCFFSSKIFSDHSSLLIRVLLKKKGGPFLFNPSTLFRCIPSQRHLYKLRFRLCVVRRVKVKTFRSCQNVASFSRGLRIGLDPSPEVLQKTLFRRIILGRVVRDSVRHHKA